MTIKLCRACRIPVLLLCIVLLCLLNLNSKAQIITTWAGTGADGNSGDGFAATVAKFRRPGSLLVDQANNLYICDVPDHRVRKITPDGMVGPYAGTGVLGYGGDNAAATAAQLYGPWGICQDPSGNIYITDQSNWVVRKVTPGGTISTFAGNHNYGYSGDGGAALSARLKRPLGIAVSGSTLYVGNEDSSIVRKINGGVISRWAGTTYGYSGNGASALFAQLSDIYGMTTDAAGNLYIADADNHVVRKVTPSGVISTFAGNGLGGFSGDNAQATNAQMQHPIGLCISPAGDLYIADDVDNRVRKVTSAGIITTVAGNGFAGYNGDNISATTAWLNAPTGVAVDANGDLYIADRENHRIRKVVRSLSFTQRPVQTLSICMNAGPTLVNALLKVQDFSVGSPVTWSLLAAPVHGTAATSYTATSSGGVLTPAGMFYTSATGYWGNDSFKVKVSNALASDSITIRVSIAPMLPGAGTIVGDSQVCAGSSVTFTNATSGGLWTSTNHCTSQSVLSGNKLVITGTSPGLDSVRYSVTNLCGTASVEKVVTVNPLPAVGNISGSGSVCIGSATTLDVSIPGGTWTSSNATVSLLPWALSCVVNGVAAGSVSVKYTTATTNCVAIAAHPMAVETYPVADSIIGPATVCAGAQVTLFNTVPFGTWTAANANASVLGINRLDFGLSLLTGLKEGVAIISYTLSNSCGTVNVSRNVSVNPQPSVPVVKQRDGVLFVPADYASYQWSLDGMPVPGATGNSQSVNGNGYYAVTVTNTEGCAVKSASFPFAGCDVSEMVIYPNPATTSVHIDWCSPVTVHVLATDGRLVSVQEDTKDAKLGHLPPGTYLLMMFNKAGTRVKVQQVVRTPG